VKARHERHARDAPFVEYGAACGRRIGMCGYRSVPTDVLVLPSFYVCLCVRVCVVMGLVSELNKVSP